MLFTVIVCYFNYFYASNLYPNILAAVIRRNRILMRLEYQPIWMIQVTCPLTFPVSCQFMVTSRQVSHILKGFGPIKVTKSPQEQIRPSLPKFP